MFFKTQIYVKKALVPVMGGHRSCCGGVGGARWVLDHSVQTPNDPSHAQSAACSQSSHQPRHPAVQLGGALGHGGGGGERRGGAAAAVAPARSSVLKKERNTL